MTRIGGLFGKPWSANPKLWGALALAFVTILVYGPTLTHDFIWDDHEQIVNNELLRSWSSLDRIWVEDVLSLTRDDGTRSNYYRPLFFLQYVVYYQAFGAHSMAWHGLALVWHFAACLAVWWLLVQMGFSLASAWAAAALFCVHPVHGESVGWAAAAFNDPPATVFILVGLTAYLSWMRTGRVRWLVGAALAYALSLGLKESSLAFVLLVPTVGVAARLHGWKERFRAVILAGLLVTPFLGIVIGDLEIFRESPLWLALVQVVLALSLTVGYSRLKDRFVTKEEWADGLFIGLTVFYLALRQATIGTVFGRFEGTVDLADTLATLPSLVLYYLKLMFWPFALGPSYSFRWAAGWSDSQAWFSVLILAVIAYGGWRLVRWHRWVGVSALWTLACLWPALNVRSFRETYLIHQRYLYLAVLGLCAGVVALAWDRLESRRAKAAVLSALFLLWSSSTLYHHRFWASDTALWQRVVELDPANAAGWDWLGASALEAGRLDEAERMFESSIEASPDSPLGYRNTALLLHWYRKRPGEALIYYESALGRFGSDSGSQETVRRTELNMAVCLSQLGRTEEAVARIEDLLHRPPYLVEAFRNLAVIEQGRGRSEKALVVLEAGLKVFPGEHNLSSMLEDLEQHRRDSGITP